MNFDLKELLYNCYLEDEMSDYRLSMISEQFETHLRDLGIENCKKVILSDLKTYYGSRCREIGFYSGYTSALELLRQLYFGK